jgi:hypothetical protein
LRLLGLGVLHRTARLLSSCIQFARMPADRLT